jgi:hypothetical protein
MRKDIYDVGKEIEIEGDDNDVNEEWMLCMRTEEVSVSLNEMRAQSLSPSSSSLLIQHI